MTDAPKVLCVDDEASVLDALRRQLHKHYDVSTAESGNAGLELVRARGPFAVIISDMRMPHMDGAEFLARARKADPETIRILLTGQADLEAAISAVNDGAIFRFLRKPCPGELLQQTIEAAVWQYRLVTSERVLLTETLQGAITSLANVLALVSPIAFGRASRARRLSVGVVAHMGIDDDWEVGVAAILSQIGAVTLPQATAERIYGGHDLTETEAEMANRLPVIAERLLSDIPRLEAVQDVLRYQNKNFDGSGYPANPIKGEQLPFGSRVLRLVLSYAALEAGGMSRGEAMERMRAEHHKYDPELLSMFPDVLDELQGRGEVRELRLHEITRGMEFAEDVVTASGKLVAARGQEATAILYERIRNLAEESDIPQPLRVVVYADGCDDGQPADSRPIDMALHTD